MSRARRGTGRRRLRLSTRISAFVAAIVAGALVLMSGAAVVAMRGWLSKEIDDSLLDSFHRVEKSLRKGDTMLSVAAGEPGAGGEGGAQSGQGDGLQSGQRDGTWAGNGPGSEHAEDTDGMPTGSKPPPGLDGPGSNEGQLQVVVKSGVISAGLIDDFAVVQLEAEEYDDLLLIPPDQRARTVTVGDHGRFRVMAATLEDGSFVLVGQSLEQLDGTTTTLLLVEGALAVTIIVVAAFLGRRWVVREMRPLGVVASTARRIGRLDLASSADIDPIERVKDEAVIQGTEVGDVGRALNAMIDNVEGALKARAESEQRLRQFVADASHELRTPLASIQGYTQLLQRDSIDLPTALTRISSESKRMSGLVEDLLLLARLDAGRELAADRVDLVPLVIDAVMDAHAAGPDHDWVLDVPDELEADKCVVSGDEAALRQVLVNLANNARIHTPPGTTVRIGVRALPLSEEDLHVAPSGERSWRPGAGPAGTVVLSVSDDGQGIPSELRDTVFDRFVRGDSSRTRSTGKGSSGLGLSIVSSIAKALGGRVEMRTSCVDEMTGDEAGGQGAHRHGTTFEVYLPREASDVSDVRA